jgi:hypothetical protein
MKTHSDIGSGGVYEIRVQGLVDESWAVWFDGMTIEPQPNGETLITGRVPDQAALHGILARIRDLNLPLLDLHRRCGL